MASASAWGSTKVFIPFVSSTRLARVVASSVHRVSAGAQRLAYARSACGVSRSGSTERLTNRSRGSAIARWTCTIFAESTGQTLVQLVKMKSAIHTEPRSDSGVRS